MKENTIDETSYKQFTFRKLDKLKDVAATDYLEKVMVDIGISPKLKRFDRLARGVRMFVDQMYKQTKRVTAVQIYDAISKETGESTRWICKQIMLAIQGAYKDNKIYKLNEYARCEFIRSKWPISNYEMICVLYQVLWFKSIEELEKDYER